MLKFDFVTHVDLTKPFFNESEMDQEKRKSIFKNTNFILFMNIIEGESFLGKEMEKKRKQTKQIHKPFTMFRRTTGDEK